MIDKLKKKYEKKIEEAKQSFYKHELKSLFMSEQMNFLILS